MIVNNLSTANGQKAGSRMRFRLLVAPLAFCFLGVCSESWAQSITPEFQAWSHSGTGTIQTDADLEKPIGKTTWTFSTWLLKTNAGWGEFYTGVTKNFNSHVSFTAQVGMEEDAHPWRVALTLLLTTKLDESYLNWEKGGSGQWYKYTLLGVFAEHFSAGIFSQTGVGSGPLFQVNLGKTKIWMVPAAFGTGQIRSITGVKYAF